MNNIKNSFSKQSSPLEVKMMNPLTLAYIGDAVYEIYIRKYLIMNYTSKVNELNKKCVKFVRATAQCEAVISIMDQLDEEELKVVKRGRNASPKTVPKNTQLIDYKMSSGFEALLGYLYLTGNIERLEYIIEKAILKTLDES
ncbi:Mini-ribonuclease 3 [Alkalibaculum sp. M08DMB]|uniref:Mini-ribonuclease 3 n=1 Tax=Alkalibaculum sporogenes TaxID=2655001 RepID=A0A6A7K5J3_9FIRM|nr:ribonuclease III domain-containing protein [Alkalibaculum sporogenes]MPW24749.1 Mini-ribonuclease 3 [Alkalibaculum sporogenes]